MTGDRRSAWKRRLAAVVAAAYAASWLAPAGGADPGEAKEKAAAWAGMVEGVADLAPRWPEPEPVVVVRRLEWPDNAWDSTRFWDERWSPPRVTEVDRADGAALAERLPEGVEFDFERLGGLVFHPPAEPKDGEKARRRHGGGGKPEGLYVVIAGTPAAAGQEGGGVRVERTWFAVYEPLRATGPDGRPLAVAVIMPGLLGTPEPVIELAVSSLRRRGYAVVRMLCQPSRFLEKVKIDAGEGEDRERAAERIASLMDERVAGCARAVRAMMTRVEADHQGWADLPCAMIGMSGGAMTLPGVVALEPERYDAAVLIAGGANLLAISIESNYAGMIDAFQLVWPGVEPGDAPKGDGWAAFNRAYLKRAALDSYHTAATLKGKPVLIIHGGADRAVPAYLGDLLWERLGKPERWASGATHEIVFAMLPSSMPQLQDWLDAALGLKRGGAAPKGEPEAAPGAAGEAGR